MIFVSKSYQNICSGCLKETSHRSLHTGKFFIFFVVVVLSTFLLLLFADIFGSWKCRLLITFANSLDPDQAQQNAWPDMDPNCLTLMVFLKIFQKCWFWKKISRLQKKKHAKIPSSQRVKTPFMTAAGNKICDIFYDFNTGLDKQKISA